MRRTTLSLPILLALSACNSPPEGLSIQLTPDEPTTLDALSAQISTDATDSSKNQTVSYTYSWTLNGDRMTDQSESEVSAANTKKNDVWEVTVTPTDGKLSGQAAIAEVTIINTPPQASLELSVESPQTHQDIKVEVTTSDADRDNVKLRYQWKLNGSVTSLTNDALRANRTRKGEVWEVSAYPNDGDVDGEPAVGTVTIANTAPEVASAKIISSITPATAAATLTCEGRGWNDADEDEEAYRVRWFVNTKEVGTTDTLIGEFVRDDSVTCELTPFDGDDAGEPRTSDALIISNAAPTAGRVVIGPEDPDRNDTVTATISEVSDLDGDEVSYIYSWRIDTREVASTSELKSSRFQRDDAITLVVYPTDGLDEGAPVTSNEIFGGNNSPTIVKNVITPDPLYTDDEVRPEIIVDDYDDDDITLTYEWYVNKTKLTVTSSSLADSFFERGDDIYVIAQADDGADKSPSVTSATVTVSNSLPTLPGLSFTPADPEPGKDTVCVIKDASTDADKDTITYKFVWKKNGTKVSGATTTYAGDTLAGASWTADDEILCEVTPNDGIDDGPTASIAAVKEFTFKDTSKDDVDGKKFMTFMKGLSPDSKDYIYFEVDSDGDTSRDGAWCSTRADWYVDQYVKFATSTGSATSSTWNKWYRNMGGKWSSVVTSGRSNIYGRACDSYTHSWCSEWGLGSKNLGFLPNYSPASNGETYAGGFSRGSDWVMTVKVAKTRKSACGF